MLDPHCCTGLSLVAVSRDCPLAEVLGLLAVAASPAGEHRLQGVRALAAAASRLNRCGSQTCGTSRHVGSSWTRDGTRVSCTGRPILYHWATREALRCSWMYLEKPFLLLRIWRIILLDRVFLSGRLIFQYFEYVIPLLGLCRVFPEKSSDSLK